MFDYKIVYRYNKMQQDKNSLLTDDDIFQQILSGLDTKQIIFAALRNSMIARGAETGFSGDVWPLSRYTGQHQNIEQATQYQYGIQGILQKDSPSLFGSWSERYVVLKGERFVYKETSSPVSPNAGILNFNLVSCDIAAEMKDNKIDNFRIFIKSIGKEFVFRGLTQQKTNEWYQAVSKVIFNSQGNGKTLQYLTKYPRFWRKDYIGQLQFRRSVQPGDILLFRGKKDTSVLQRAVTRDQYDHVAAVLLNQMGEPLIFEANGGLGVGICPWMKFMERKWWNQYEIIVHRKLRVNRNDQFVDIVEKFVGATMGKNYDFSLTDYIFERSSSADKDHKSYFCSSLVAKLYKKLGLLPEKKTCKSYLPSSFASKDNLCLTSQGQFGYAFLENEKIIVFEGV